MQVKTISYGRTKNLGNYQSERLDVTAELSDGEDETTAFEQLKTWVAQRLYPETVTAEADVIPY
jgi:hypothetical protein